MKNLKVLAQYGSASLEALFPDFGGIFKVDALISKFLVLNESSNFEVVNDFFVNLKVHEKGGKFFDLFHPWPIMQGRNKILATLAYLGTPEGFKFLETKDGQDKANVLLGYFQDGVKNFMFHIEHKHKTGEKPKIHLLASPPSKSEEGPIVTFYIN